MRVAIHQPQYMPWLGYFHKMDQVDKFIHLDTVQFKKNEYQNRNRIKAPNGWHWLTVPVIYSDHKQLIKDVQINNTIRWRHKHKQSLTSSYGRAEHYQDIMDAMEWVFEEDWENLSVLNIAVVERMRELLGIATETTLASELGVNTRQPDRRIIALVKAVGGDTYVAGPGGKNYMDLETYESEGINVVFSTFNHPTYGQLFGEFQLHMSTVDLLFNQGGNSLDIIRGKQI